MHTLSTRTLSALAFDRGEEYDPAEPVCLGRWWRRCRWSSTRVR